MNVENKISLPPQMIQNSFGAKFNMTAKQPMSILLSIYSYIFLGLVLLFLESHNLFNDMLKTNAPMVG